MFITVYVGLCAVVLHVETRGQLCERDHRCGVHVSAMLSLRPPSFLCWSGVHVNLTLPWEGVGTFTHTSISKNGSSSFVSLMSI